MQKSAIILGATGLTGSHVLKMLLSDVNYNEIRVLSRKPTGVIHPKLKEQIGDLFDLDSSIDFLVGDEMYICIGTTKKKTPDKDIYRKIDFGIPAKVANIARNNGVSKIAVVSAIGANAKSTVTYNRLKGEMEEAVLKAGVDRTYILRPSFITGNRNENRLGEKIGIILFKFFEFIIPRKYRAVEAKSIANKMIELCNSNNPSVIVESSEI